MEARRPRVKVTRKSKASSKPLAMEAVVVFVQENQTERSIYIAQVSPWLIGCLVELALKVAMPDIRWRVDINRPAWGENSPTSATITRLP